MLYGCNLPYAIRLDHPVRATGLSPKKARQHFACYETMHIKVLSTNGTYAEHTEFDLDQIATEQYGIDDDVINYLNNGQTLQKNGIKCIRNSQDKIKNNYGNKLLEICRNNNLYICNGRVKGDEIGALTCV